MAVPRSLYLLVGAAAAPVGVCASALAPVAGVLAGAVAVRLVLLLTAAGALLAADWRTEAESRQAWAEVAPRWAEGKAGVRRQSADIDTRYLAASEKEALRRVFRVHRVLPSQAAAVVRLRYFGGLSIEDTALVLGISAPTVKRAWVFARAWLKETLEREA